MNLERIVVTYASSSAFTSRKNSPPEISLSLARLLRRTSSSFFFLSLVGEKRVDVLEKKRLEIGTTTRRAARDFLLFSQATFVQDLRSGFCDNGEVHSSIKFFLRWRNANKVNFHDVCNHVYFDVNFAYARGLCLCIDKYSENNMLICVADSALVEGGPRL